MSALKPKHLLSLLQSGFTTIQVQFPPDLVQGAAPAGIERHDRNSGITTRHAVPDAKQYTYKIEGSCEVGDTVIVDSPYSGLTCVKVVNVDDEPRIDLNAEFTYKWVVQRVDTSAYRERLDKEEAFLKQIEGVQRTAMRDQLLRQHAETFPVGSVAREEFDKAMNAFNPALAAQLKAVEA